MLQSKSFYMLVCGSANVRWSLNSSDPSGFHSSLVSLVNITCTWLIKKTSMSPWMGWAGYPNHSMLVPIFTSYQRIQHNIPSHASNSDIHPTVKQKPPHSTPPQNRHNSLVTYAVRKISMISFSTWEWDSDIIHTPTMQKWTNISRF